MTSFLRAIFWAAVVLGLVIALIPQPPQLPGSPSDKVQHVIAFALLAALGSAAYRAASAITLLLWLSAFGALIEFLQGIPALHRDSDVMDWVADTLAAAVVLAVIWGWRRMRLRDA